MLAKSKDKSNKKIRQSPVFILSSETTEKKSVTFCLRHIKILEFKYKTNVIVKVKVNVWVLFYDIFSYQELTELRIY